MKRFRRFWFVERDGRRTKITATIFTAQCLALANALGYHGSHDGNQRRLSCRPNDPSVYQRTRSGSARWNSPVVRSGNDHFQYHVRRRLLIAGLLLGLARGEQLLLARTGRMTSEMQLIFAIITVCGSGVSVYLGVRIALAELRTNHASLDKRVEKTEARLDRLEARYFKAD